MKYDKLTYKKNQLDSLRPLAPTLLRNLDDWFKVELTYTSNAIEGNTLTRQETAVVIEKGLTVGGKTLRRTLRSYESRLCFRFCAFFGRKKPISIKC
jgi:Fic family protein